MGLLPESTRLSTLNRSGAPLPSASSVTPAVRSDRLSLLEITAGHSRHGDSNVSGTGNAPHC